MFLQLGTYKFEGIKLPQSWSRSKETLYAQTPIIGGKAVVQQIGEKLEEIELGIYLSSDFCTPKTEIENLNSIRTKAIVSNLVDGTGKNYGKFVITSIKEDVITTLDNGYITGISATLSLLEYNTSDTVLKQTGKAVGSKISESPLVPLKNNLQIGLTGISSGINMSKSLAADLKKGQMSVGKLSKLQQDAQNIIDTFNKAKNDIDKVQKAVIRGAYFVKEQINKVNGYVTEAKILAARLQTATEAIKNIPGAVLNGDSLQDYADLFKQGDLITVGCRAINVASAPLAAIAGSRESI